MDPRAGVLGDPERLRALRATELLDALPQAAFDRLTRLATRAVGVPVSLVTLVDADRQYNFSSSASDWALQGGELSVPQSFCSVVVRRAAPFVTVDIEDDRAGVEFPGLRGTKVRAYAGPGALPVLATDGVKLAQILRNLTTNALRHTVAGEIVVTAEAGPGATVLFHVTRSGSSGAGSSWASCPASARDSAFRSPAGWRR